MKFIFSLLLVVFAQVSFGQSKTTDPDSLRGALRLERSCYDVTYYDLAIEIRPDSQSIQGSNIIHFKAVEKSKFLQVDLFEQYTISAIYLGVPLDDEGDLFERIELLAERRGDAFFVELPDSLVIGDSYQLEVLYNGTPNVAKRAPWDGGFVWEQDSLERHFVGVACEGHGASSWWPCKDHLSDEPDSMRMEFTVPSGYQCVSNGRLVWSESIDTLRDKFIWEVSYPINSYNVTFYLGMLEEIQGRYISGSDTLSTSFYALDYNLEKAKKQFEQVNPMLAIYEDLFGTYPFWEDGYKLVEAPYLGMEHQSAIAYGNGYQNGYQGAQPKGVDFDYIIIHESGHEYWGNSISMSDVADMWIHESFCTYTEVLYAEKMYGKDIAHNYLRSQRGRMANKEAIIGSYEVNKEGSGDMYNKGAWILHSVRNMVNNDSVWFATIKQFHEDFRLRITNSDEVLDWWGNALGSDVKVVLTRFLTQPEIPVILYEKKKFLWWKWVNYKWKDESEDFKMPIWFGTDSIQIVVPTDKWQSIKVEDFEKMRRQLNWKFFLYDIEEVEE